MKIRCYLIVPLTCLLAPAFGAAQNREFNVPF